MYLITTLLIMLILLNPILAAAESCIKIQSTTFVYLQNNAINTTVTINNPCPECISGLEVKAFHGNNASGPWTPLLTQEFMAVQSTGTQKAIFALPTSQYRYIRITAVHKKYNDVVDQKVFAQSVFDPNGTPIPADSVDIKKKRMPSIKSIKKQVLTIPAKE